MNAVRTFMEAEPQFLEQLELNCGDVVPTNKLSPPQGLNTDCHNACTVVADAAWQPLYDPDILLAPSKVYVIAN